jgi:hypothetical protein
MYKLDNIEMAVNIVRQADTPSEKTYLVNRILEGELDAETEEGKNLLHRRTLFITALRLLEVWEHEST